MMVKPTVSEIVNERGKAYGEPWNHHARTAMLWNAYIGAKKSSFLGATDVCFMNILQKISRSLDQAGPSVDSVQDIAGYAENILEIMKHRKLSDEYPSI